MVACFPTSAEGKREYTDMGHCLRDNGAARWNRGGGGVGAGRGTKAGKAEGEDGGGREGRGEERALAIGRVFNYPRLS